MSSGMREKTVSVALPPGAAGAGDVATGALAGAAAAAVAVRDARGDRGAAAGLVSTLFSGAGAAVSMGGIGSPRIVAGRPSRATPATSATTSTPALAAHLRHCPAA